MNKERKYSGSQREPIKKALEDMNKTDREALIREAAQRFRKNIRGGFEIIHALDIYTKEVTKIVEQALSDKDDELRELILHCWVHSGYENCGYKQMTTKQKALYDSIIASLPQE